MRKRQTLDVGVEADVDALGVERARDLAPGPVRSRETGRHFAALEQVRVQLLHLVLELLRKSLKRLGFFQRQNAVGRQVIDDRRGAQEPAVELQVRVQLLHLVLELLRKSLKRLGFFQRQNAVGRQVIDDRRGAQEPAVELQRGESMVTFVQQPQIASERINELRSHAVEAERHWQRPRQHLVGRSDGGGLQLVAGALGGGVEQADRIDLVAPQLDAEWLAAGRKDVEDAAAAAEEAGCIDQGRRLVAQSEPLRRQLGRRQYLDRKSVV